MNAFSGRHNHHPRQFKLKTLSLPRCNIVLSFFFSLFSLFFTMNIHILGTGAIGCHIGSVLKAHKHKVTLLLRSPAHLTDFRNRDNTITYQHKGETKLISGIEAQTMEDHGLPITSLIIATKAHHTMDAIRPIASQLSSKSTILLLQNGMGVAEELVETFWPHQGAPIMLAGVNRHAVERIAPFNICHHSGTKDPDALNIGFLPSEHTVQENALADALTGIPELQAKRLTWNEIRLKMLKKLVINACINPVASILGCQNKGVLTKEGTALMRSICEETHRVIGKDLPNESVDSLMEIVLDIARSAGENKCSTLQDMEAKRLTEIDYLNGYICKLGKQKGIDTRTNQALVNLIHAKESLF